MVNILLNEEKPLPGEELVPYEKPLVDAVEHLVRLARRAGATGKVETEKHWEVIEAIFGVWANLYPQEYKDFRQFQVRQKLAQRNKSIAREGEAMVQHQLEIPRKFHDLLNVIFPDQKITDKKFISKLMQRMPLLNMKA